ncbi:cupin domain-containing protein [Nostoc sp.]|uniref:cupin domain-containing protein n=1 Tax=Nostoc sp. TaxID=1180 RepID=UPI002FFB86AC
MFSTNFDFEKLIQPIDTVTFFKEYWERQCLVVSRGEPDYYSGLFSMNDVDSLIRFSGIRYCDFNVSKVADDLSNQANKLGGKGSIDPNASPSIYQFYDAYNQGNTLCIFHLQQHWEAIATLCRNLEKYLNHPANVNLYLTPKTAQGFPPHFDTHDVFVLQLSGTKLWRTYDSYWDLPMPEDARRLPQEVLREQLKAPTHEVELKPGDMLYIPRGFVHEAKTLDTSSLHITVGIPVYRWVDLIQEALTSIVQQNVEFRKAVPVSFVRDDDAKTQTKNQLKDLLKTFASSVDIDDAVERLTIKFIGSLSPLADSHFSKLDDLQQIDLNTHVVKRQGMICTTVRKGDVVMIQFPQNRVEAPAYVEPAFRFIAESEAAFEIKSLPDFASDNSKIVLVRRLLKEGLLTIV